ncbi:hypothetical protein B0H13DRAFT_1867233 [Mycena leptocephala]|nr:hypothetical protein B0H13DRAFT_1867233 [Mycena leptocephala]
MAAPQYRCEYPFFPDSGQSAVPTAGQKLWLVTGNSKVVQAGAYASWNTAGVHSQGIGGGVHVQKYGPHKRAAMRAAWHSACDHGEHDHPADPVLFSAQSPAAPPGLRLWTPSPAPTSPRAPAGKRKLKIFSDNTPVAFPTSGRVVMISSRSPSPTTPSFTLGTAPAPGLPAFAVRAGGCGWVFSDAGDARDKFHRLQLRGQKVEAATGNGFTHALAFAEGSSAASSSAKGERRHRLAAAQQEAEQEAERVAQRNEILDDLQYYREGETDHSSDESDCSWATDDLERRGCWLWGYGVVLHVAAEGELPLGLLIQQRQFAAVRAIEWGVKVVNDRMGVEASIITDWTQKRKKSFVARVPPEQGDEKEEEGNGRSRHGSGGHARNDQHGRPSWGVFLMSTTGADGATAKAKKAQARREKRRAEKNGKPLPAKKQGNPGNFGGAQLCFLEAATDDYLTVSSQGRGHIQPFLSTFMASWWRTFPWYIDLDPEDVLGSLTKVNFGMMDTATKDPPAAGAATGDAL